ncbi:MAG TPA: VWA domain-containing protein, partial [Anaerolineaceae bacterium]|nr:VWA domain-containing protein [Anaerolineaceae bacterium]
DLLAPSSLMDGYGKEQLLQRIRTIDAGGMTYLSGGWLMGCEQVAGAAGADTLNRVLLLTDGLANQGITEPEELRMHAHQLSLRGVSTSTFGVGEGFNEHLLEGIANRGGGNFYYISRPEEIPGIFHREFSELVTVTAKNVELEFTIPSNVDAQVKGEWTHERGGNRLLVNVGDLLGGRPQEIYLKLLIPPFQEQPEVRIEVRVRGAGADGGALEDAAAFGFTYADQSAVMAAPLQPGVVEPYAAVHLGDVVTEALKLERAGKVDQARQLLDSELSRHIHDLNRSDQVLYQTVANRMKRGMSESDRKEAHFQSYLNKRGKNQDQ